MKRGPADESTTTASKQIRASSRARIAVVGAGAWAQGWHLPHLHTNEDAEIAAIIGPFVDSRANYKPGDYKSMEEIMEEEKKSFEESIAIAVPIKAELKKNPCFAKLPSIHITAVIFSYYAKNYKVIGLCQ